MRFVIVGLGSMGKRRVRCLKSLGYEDVAGFDLRSDRRDEAAEKYGIATYGSIDEAIKDFKPTAMIISVPPDIHHQYIKIALENNIHFFVEASVVDTDIEQIKEQLKEKDVVCAPSATMCYHPAVKLIAQMVNNGDLGKVSNVIYHSGQYLADWHVYESVSDYYVSNPMTGGCREIVPFELGWITNMLGFPKRVCGNKRKTVEIKGAEDIDDTYNCLLDYDDCLVSLTVDVVSRYATRRLLINGDQKQLRWDWNDDHIQLFSVEEGAWKKVPYKVSAAEEGYNKNIGENMYIDEIRNFLSAIGGKEKFLNSMENDHNVLKLLYAIEESDKNSRIVDVNI